MSGLERLRDLWKQDGEAIRLSLPDTTRATIRGTDWDIRLPSTRPIQGTAATVDQAKDAVANLYADFAVKAMLTGQNAPGNSFIVKVDKALAMA
ncbi:MAG: hypothetical protein HQ581_23765 [Planctomycetes bacterium]|nr:hypothetical protein [Planctomycetota bacterium]